MQYLVAGSKPLVCQGLIGREREWGELEEAWQQASTGRPQLVFLSGEAGLGKTKLCRSFAASIRTGQGLVFSGQAIAQNQGLPLGLLRTAFQPYLTHAFSDAAEDDSRQAPLFTFLRQLFPEIVASSSGSLNGMSQHPQAIFHGLVAALQALVEAHGQPMLLVLEDLQRADETSLEVLALLAHRLDVNAEQPTTALPLLIVGTYRPEALQGQPALKRLLLQLYSQRKMRDIHLAPLSAAAHRECLSCILEQPIPQEFVDSLFAWDEGNPFFLEELLGALVATGQLHPLQGQQGQQAEQGQSTGWLIPSRLQLHLPVSLADAILERFEQLPARDQDVLAYAAVIGRSFDFSLLGAVCGLDEYELVAVLRRAMNLQLISEVRGVNATPCGADAAGEQVCHQFRHALTREAIYEQMLLPELRLRHRVVAEALEAYKNSFLPGTGCSTFRQEDIPRLLTHHYRFAGMPEQARTYALREAERARSIFAFREEQYYLNMAQSSLPEQSFERLRLLERLGRSCMGSFDFAGAIHWLTLALEGYQRLGCMQEALQVQVTMLLPHWFLARRSMPELLDELEATAREVAQSAAPGDASILLVSSLITLYRMMSCQHLRQQSAALAQSVSLFQDSLDDPRRTGAILLAQLAHGWSKAHQQATAAEEGIAEVRTVLAIAQQCALPDLIMLCYSTLSTMLMNLGRNDEVEEFVEAMAQFEVHAGALRRSLMRGWNKFYLGEQWDEAIALLRADMKLMEQTGIPALLAIEKVSLAHLLIARGELEEAGELIQAAQPVLELMDEYAYLLHAWWARVKLCVALGDVRQAQCWYERMLSRWQTTEDTLLILPVLLDAILLYADTGNIARAELWLDELQALANLTDNAVAEAAVLEAQGTLFARTGLAKEAIDMLRLAEEAWASIGRRYQQALVLHRLAEFLLRSTKGKASRAEGQTARKEAEALLDQAEVIYGQLHMTTGRQAIQRLRSTTYLQAQQRRRSTLKARHSSMGLTRREMQVLELLVAGKTNKEIASSLCISTGTVEVHITHIFAKLGCETRTQAVVRAEEQGWFDEFQVACS